MENILLFKNTSPFSLKFFSQRAFKIRQIIKFLQRHTSKKEGLSQNFRGDPIDITTTVLTSIEKIKFYKFSVCFRELAGEKKHYSKKLLTRKFVIHSKSLRVTNSDTYCPRYLRLGRK